MTDASKVERPESREGVPIRTSGWSKASHIFASEAFSRESEVSSFSLGSLFVNEPVSREPFEGPGPATTATHATRTD